MTVKRTVIIVLDSVGVGELPDAASYGDQGSNTLGNTAARMGGLDLPNLAKVGLGNIIPIMGVKPVSGCTGAYGKMAEQSVGKDTTTGHWEISGLILKSPFPTYPNGFPAEVIEAFKQDIGRDILANKPASGTQIIEELGEEHMKTGYPIVYTSADSVFQIAAHEDVIPLNELYKMCRIARKILTGQHGVGRVIARPFIGEPGAFERTTNRRDFSLAPPRPTILDKMTDAGKKVYAVGKIEDIFAGKGISEAVHTVSNKDVVMRTINYMKTTRDEGIIFANCVDFDMLWGHRNNVDAYAGGLEEFDSLLPEVIDAMNPDDLLIILADHGCDPTTPSTDHSREYVPLLLFGESVKSGTNLGIRKTFADVAATLADIYYLEPPEAGVSFFQEVLK